MNVFPASNLPVQTQTWGREVEKRINNLDTAFRAAEVNNVTRDSQLISNYRRLDAAFTQLRTTTETANTAQDASIEALSEAQAANAAAISALQGLGSLDEATSTYKINASNVNVGTLDASVVNVVNLNASNITTGSLSADRISGGTIDADDITVINLDASSITTGSFSADRISGGVIDASDISGVNITGGTINGTDIIGVDITGTSTITGATITGGSLNTAASGTRVRASGTNIEFYSSAYAGGGSRVGYIQGDDLGSPGLYMISDQGSIGIDAVSITLSGDTTVTGELEVNGSFSPSSISTGSVTATGLTVNGSASVSGTLSAGSFNPSSISTGAITASSVSVGTSSITGTSVYGQSVTGDSVGGGNANFTGSVTGQSGIISNSVLTRTELIGGGTTGASVTNGGNFVRTTSSRRYKTDIQPLELDLNDLYSVEPKTFKRIEEVEEDAESARTYPGFIAEELAGTSLDKFVFYSKDENGAVRPEGIHYPELTAALLIAIKDLNSRIAILESKVE